MLGSELQSRARKLEREQKQRLERERQAARKERLAGEEARQQRLRHEEEASRRRAAALAAADLERQQHDEEVVYNNGVWWSEQLTLVPLAESAAAEKGIKRGADKVCLPPSAGRSLMAQDAPKNGPMFFELAAPGLGRTHAGLLDFTAAEGTVGVPPEVAASLSTVGLPEAAQLTVTYRRLEKGTFVRFQPETADFQRLVGEGVEDALVAALSRRSVISDGDRLAVAFAGETYQLRVQKLQPARQVSVIDTEMEADVEPSVETEERLAREAAEALARRQEAARSQAAAEAALQQQATAALEEARRRERLRQEREASLPPEPSSGEASTLCMIRFPDGSRQTRRLRHQDTIATLFHFVDAKGGGGLGPGEYRLATQFPRRVFVHDNDETLANAGLDPRQEVFLLEPTSAAQPVL